jgi:hypothetical protein
VVGKREPQFFTRRCKADQVSKAKWRLEIEFQVFNPTGSREMVIDDLHARLFEWDAHAPPLATISFYGDVWLTQDNSILKEQRVYSLPPGDGYIINLVFEATRVEAAPAYGMAPHESEGSVAIVFGLLLDYYFLTTPMPDRRAIPSDRIYMFTYSKGDDDASVRALDQRELNDLRTRNSGGKDALAFIKRIEDYLEEHLSFHPEPIPSGEMP